MIVLVFDLLEIHDLVSDLIRQADAIVLAGGVVLRLVDLVCLLAFKLASEKFQIKALQVDRNDIVVFHKRHSKLRPIKLHMVLNSAFLHLFDLAVCSC